MKSNIVSAWVIMLFSMASNAAIDLKNGDGRYILKGNAPVRLSVETGWKREGLTPVRVDIQGLNLLLGMDGEGRVFDNVRLQFGRGKIKTVVRRELFRLNKTSGQLIAGEKVLTGRVDEQNALRTRLRFDNLMLAIHLDMQKGQAALDLDGIVILIRMRLGIEADDGRELMIGERGHRGEGRFLLNARQGRLYYEDNRILPAVDDRQSDEACWAERQK